MKRHHVTRWQPRVQTATVREWDDRIAAIVATLPESERECATQVARIGLLTALERWEVGGAFEQLAYATIADELRRWQDSGTIVWRAKRALGA
ncbi:MAG: hypothetical protein JOZ69_01635 [Myxococcales bacterium]|nr:hypothetical protein [Myxococcales bacterium]